MRIPDHSGLYEQLNGVGFGSVCKMKRKADNTHLAARVLVASTKREHEKQVKEVRQVLSMKLKHKKVAQCLDFFTTEHATPGNVMQRSLFIIMPLYTGGNLEGFVRSRGELDCYTALKLLGDIGSALAYLHEMKYVHCGVNPHNTLLSNTGEVGGKNVTFILSGLGPRNETVVDVKNPPMYLAPECLTPPYTSLIDAWALGATVCYAVLEEGDRNLLQKYLHHNHSFVMGVLRAALEECVGEPLEEVLLRLLSESPSERPSASEIVGLVCVPSPRNDTRSNEKKRNKKKSPSVFDSFKNFVCCGNPTPHPNGKNPIPRNRVDEGELVSLYGVAQGAWLYRVSKGNFEDIKRRLKKHPVAPVKTLHRCALEGNIDAMKLLVEAHKIDPGCKDTEGWRPLHMASCGGNLEAVQLLIREYHQDPRVKGKDNNTPLHCAVLHGQVTIIEVLVDKNKHRDEGILHFAARNGCIEAMRHLIDKHGHKPGCAIKRGVTPLHVAAEAGRIDILRLLIEVYDQSPGVQGADGWTPLHHAALNGQIAVMRVLIDDYQQDPNSKTGAGWTCLHAAATSGSVAAMRLLIEVYGQDPSVKDDDGETPLHHAAGDRSLEVVSYLIDGHGQNPNVKDCKGWAPLHHAARRGSAAALKILLEDHQQNPLEKTMQGETAYDIVTQKKSENSKAALILRDHMVKWESAG
eukprot:TRINITY_DN5711_c0_g2_i1.p1 TRINITY_DN5711_c0_g2~~TRINITY_DN5711_c0_g2_i1.p1  ORF type:complete len:691 (+),score=86.89 TRINITY_DN5711_c0_g2_i1:64-2136(+)